MEFINQDLLHYAEQHSEPENPLLARINRETHAQVLMPRMLSGHLQGRFLSLLSRLKKPKRILEIGTYTGYSALCLAEGLSSSGFLHTIDNNAELRRRVSAYFQESAFAKQIVYHIGQAADIIPQLNETFDLVFIDADKKNYLHYLHLLKGKLAPNALVIADNVLWSGKVLQGAKPQDRDTLALQQFNDAVASMSAFRTVLLPLRDGLSLMEFVGQQA